VLSGSHHPEATMIAGRFAGPAALLAIALAGCGIAPMSEFGLDESSDTRCKVWRAASDEAASSPAPDTVQAKDDAPKSNGNGNCKDKNNDQEKNGKDQDPDKKDKANGNDKKDENDKDKDKEEDKCKLLPEGWNFHAQTTLIPNFDAGFGAKYSGPNSLGPQAERRGTISADLIFGVPLWHGAEFHADILMWQGFGLSNSFGLEAFPNSDAFKAGTADPRFMFSHFFVRQTIGLGGEQEDVPDGPFTLPGKRDVSRLTITVGRLNMAELFDYNTYNHDPHTQFMNWASTILTWDYPADTIGSPQELPSSLINRIGPSAMGGSSCPAFRMVSPPTTGFSCIPSSPARKPPTGSFGNSGE
jgi:hypothetical protein